MLNPTFFSWVSSSQKVPKPKRSRTEATILKAWSNTAMAHSHPTRMLLWDIHILGETPGWILLPTSHETFADTEEISAKASPPDTHLRFTHGTVTPLRTGSVTPRELHHHGTGTSQSSPCLYTPTNTELTLMFATTLNRNTSSPNMALLPCKPPLCVSRHPRANVIPSPCHKLLGRKRTDRLPDEQSCCFALVAEN